MRLRNSVLILILLICSSIVFAEDAEEKIFSFEDDTYHSTELSETLEKIRKQPFDINKASRKELEKLPWLSEKDIEKIIEWRERKHIKNWKDIASIGINEITISDLEHYIIFKPEFKINIKQVSRVEFNEAKEKIPSTLKYYQRTICGYKDLKLGILTQKDEGENDPIDFYSYFVEYKSNSFLKHSVLGKYRLAFGQGIIFAPKLGMSKSGAATSTPVKKSSPVKPYTSSYEIWELEGGTVQCNYRNFSIIPFFSSTKLSANLSDNKITSFNQSGLHLDEEKKDNVEETIFGTALNFNLGSNS
ncbi:MAG: helix-hairpin-helix domain-containing protein, partial [Candidatus Cloacimonetes bacterium]|nr:helix-hairpin-helix domain-containing protein [Candidatus Cloacimonadota bacterium]